MPPDITPSAHKVQATLNSLGYNHQVIEHEETTRTAFEAAAAIECDVGQIVKPLIIKAKNSGKAILVIASGPNRVKKKIIRDEIGEKIGRADVDFVREQIGSAIGDIPPIGLIQSNPGFIDEDLLQYIEIWAAAGTPNAVFKLRPNELVEMTGGKVIKIVNTPK
ncbi:MAG: YbaK/EbsC family protein [Chloroflexi bacterium]|nr:YbaK/EbsC family protein [Chloroflexota bacterium]